MRSPPRYVLLVLAVARRAWRLRNFLPPPFPAFCTLPTRSAIAAHPRTTASIRPSPARDATASFVIWC